MFFITGWLAMLVAGGLYHTLGWPINYGYWVWVLIALLCQILIPTKQ